MPASREANGRAKLTEIEVAEIRDALDQGVLQKELAKRYGVAQTTISQIKLNKHWVSSQPRLIHRFNSRPIEERFWKKVNKSSPTECWLWMGAKHPDGYGQICKDGQSVHAHRIAWELTYGEIPKGMSVLHRCDQPSCVNPTHLFLGNQIDNIKDMCSKKRDKHPRGENHVGAKLTIIQVSEIRGALRNNYKGLVPQLAMKYGVSIGAIRGIKSNRTWKEERVEARQPRGCGETGENTRGDNGLRVVFV